MNILFRMRCRFLLFLTFLFISKSFFGQKDSAILIITVSDSRTAEGINNVKSTFTFSFSETPKIKFTNGSGKTSLFVFPNTIVNYDFSHPLYSSFSKSKKIGNVKNGDTILVDVELNPITSRTLREVVVRPPGTPDTVFNSEELSVADFEVLHDGRLVLLVYPKQLKKGSELLLYDGYQVISSFDIPDVAEEIFRDFRGNAQVICKENVFGLELENDKVNIVQLPKDYFMSYIAPIIDTSTTKMFFSNFNKDYPAFDYFAYDQLDSAYKKIVKIEDELMMELYRSEYKWVDVRTKLWAKQKEIETGIDAEIWVGANYFTQSIYYKELYAPMFVKNDSIFVFNYYKDQLMIFDKNGEALDSLAIYHHYNPKLTGWQKKIIQDRYTGNIYAIFDKDGYSSVGLIDLSNGEISEKVKLSFRYVEKIRIHNNYIYYVYRPFESAQRKFLYRERLPYSFGASQVPQGMETSIETGK